jgi:hypothetical protein
VLEGAAELLDVVAGPLLEVFRNPAVNLAARGLRKATRNSLPDEIVG